MIKVQLTLSVLCAQILAAALHDNHRAMLLGGELLCRAGNAWAKAGHCMPLPSPFEHRAHAPLPPCFQPYLCTRTLPPVLAETTFGKGKIQSVFELGDGSALFVTVAKYKTPAGHEIDKVGIRPDRACR